MATRTIESPGVEWNEYDLSQVISYANGTNVVVMGFAHQGPTNQVVEITSKEELLSVFFGNVGPYNAAERYFYHSCLEILNTSGKLLCIRLPYGSGKGSGFSTGFVATAFFGEVKNMTSGEAWSWLSGEGGTSAYIQTVFDGTPDGERQPVLRLNPTPQSFVLSPDLYEEIKAGAVEWKTPVYQPDEMILKGYTYVYHGDKASGEYQKGGSVYPSPYGDNPWPSASGSSVWPIPDSDIGNSPTALSLAPSSFYGEYAYNEELSAKVVITPENFSNVYLKEMEKADAYLLTYKDPSQNTNIPASALSGEGEIASAWYSTFSGTGAEYSTDSEDWKASAAYVNPADVESASATGASWYLANDNSYMSQLEYITDPDTKIQFSSGEGTGSDTILGYAFVKDIVFYHGMTEASGLDIVDRVSAFPLVGDDSVTVKMVTKDGFKLDDNQVAKFVGWFTNAPAEDEASYSDTAPVIAEEDNGEGGNENDNTAATGQSVRRSKRSARSRRAVSTGEMLMVNTDPIQMKDIVVGPGGVITDPGEIRQYTFGVNSNYIDFDSKTGRLGFHRAEWANYRTMNGELTYHQQILNAFETRITILNGMDEFPITMLTKGTGVLEGSNTIVTIGEDGDMETASGMMLVASDLKPYYTWSTSATVVEQLSHAAFFTINQTESSIDEDYQGFYMTVADQDSFVRRGKSIFSNAGLDTFVDGIQAFSMDNVDLSESATSAYDSGVTFEVATWPNPADPNPDRSTWITGNVANCPDNVKASAEWVVDEYSGDQIVSAGNPLDIPADSVRLDTLQVPTRLLNFRVTGQQSLSQQCVDGLPYVFDRPVYANCIEIGVHRLFTSLENDRLVYATNELFTGSFNPEATIGTKNGGRENYSLDMMATNHSSYITLFQNRYFERSDHTPILARFGERINSYGEFTKRRTDGVCVSLGGYRACKEENANEFIGNLPAKIDNALLLIDSPLERDIDILIDGGLSTIWGYTYGFGEVMEKMAEDATGLDYTNTGYDAKEFDDTKYIGKAFKKLMRNLGSDGFFNDRAACAIKDSVYSIFTQFNVFCSKTRKDCVFISDPPRWFFVQGEDTKASSRKDWVFSLDMYNPLKNLYEAANSSYACTYMNWVKKYDNALGDFVWLPMSPFAAEIMCEVDARYFMWWAPFGLNNGVLSTITDIAFRPNQGQCDYFYKTGFNPVCYFNDGGFVIWGQKTMLDVHSAFDRINVRRLFLYLERRTVKALRYFVGEPNTAATRSRVITTLEPMYSYCVANSGLYDYKLVCDEGNNPPEVIDDNTLVVDIYLKPVRSVEYILANFWAVKTGADFSEIIG